MDKFLRLCLFQSNRSQPAIGLKQTPKARVSSVYNLHYIYCMVLFFLNLVTVLPRVFFPAKERAYGNIIDSASHPGHQTACSQNASRYLADIVCFQQIR